MSDDALEAWIGRTEDSRDVAASGPLEGLVALLDHDSPPLSIEHVPPLAHWLYFVPRVRQSRIGIDGHPVRGGAGIIPPIELPRRMWAGSRVTFIDDIAVGAELSRRSTLTDIKHKAGGSGDMVFITLRHEISAGGRLCVLEEQDIVYREQPKNTTGQQSTRVPEESPGPVAVSRPHMTDSVQLFRFSALTFNSHRIHYDREYAAQEEGYPGLVVHGPYLAILLMNHFLRSRPGRTVKGFQFRARAPVFEGVTFLLNLADTEDGAKLWVSDGQGQIGMTATVTG